MPLDQLSIAQHLTADELEQLSSAGDQQVINQNTALLTEGQKGNTLYGVLSGQIDVIKDTGPAGLETVATLNPGDVFGEMGFLFNLPSPVTFRASTDCQLFTLPRPAYDQLAATGQAIGNKLTALLAENFTQKLTWLTDQVANLLVDHESLLHTVEQLKQGEASPQSQHIQAELQSQVQQFRAKAVALKQRMYTLKAERDEARSATQTARLTTALVMGAFGLLLLGNIVGWTKALSQAGDKSQRSYPAVIPGINSQEECEQRSGSVWANGECLDFEHDRTF